MIKRPDLDALSTYLFHAPQNHWKNLNPEQKLEAHFFEDELKDGYNNYRVLIKIVGFLGLLAITISLLGMLGIYLRNQSKRSEYPQGDGFYRV